MKHSAVLLTGGNGYLGCLVAATLLAGTDRHLVLPLRATADPQQCRERIAGALIDLSIPTDAVEGMLSRTTTIQLLPDGRMDNIDREIAVQIDEIVHCAGCVDYFDEKALQRANVDYTHRLLTLGRVWGVQRFIYLSTAFTSGYRSGLIPELLHPDPKPANEPTAYTRSKRMAERLVADSSIPFLIVRPSIIIGDSRSGKYNGKNYGLYQIWRAIEGLLCREYTPVWHTIAPPVPLNLVHQDAFQAAILRSYHRNDSDEILHLVSDDKSAPTMRELCWMWAGIYRPLEIHSYASIDDVPLITLPRRQRRFLELAWKNFEIATHPWQFEMTGMNQLRSEGLVFTDPTTETVKRCQHRYIEQSPRILAYMREHPEHDGREPRLIEWFESPDLSAASM